MGSVVTHVKLFVSWHNGAMSEDVGRLIAMTVFLPLDEEKLEVELRKLHTLWFSQ